MVHFFARANARLFGGKFAVDARYRPRNGADFDLLAADGQGMVAVTDMDLERPMDRNGMMVPGLSYDVPDAPFAALGIQPRERDTVVFDGDVVRYVKTAQRRDDGLNWRLFLGETSS